MLKKVILPRSPTLLETDRWSDCCDFFPRPFISRHFSVQQLKLMTVEDVEEEDQMFGRTISFLKKVLRKRCTTQEMESPLLFVCFLCGNVEVCDRSFQISNNAKQGGTPANQQQEPNCPWSCPALLQPADGDSSGKLFFYCFLLLGEQQRKPDQPTLMVTATSLFFRIHFQQSCGFPLSASISHGRHEEEELLRWRNYYQRLILCRIRGQRSESS